jgi:hypothetical protein
LTLEPSGVILTKIKFVFAGVMVGGQGVGRKWVEKGIKTALRRKGAGGFFGFFG